MTAMHLLKPAVKWYVDLVIVYSGGKEEFASRGTYRFKFKARDISRKESYEELRGNVFGSNEEGERRAIQALRD
jgi:hypothetical protein